MPTYTYKCPRCGHSKDYRLQLRFVNTYELYCPICVDDVYAHTAAIDETRMKRVFSAPAIHFKGKGFYSTGG